jgi:3'-5' exoribonuclease
MIQMSRKLQNQPIRSLGEGDSVSGYALLTKKELRQDKNGRDYLDLELVDASGAIIGKVWSDSRALGGDFERHDFVAYQGTVHRFRDQLQLNVKECRRVTDQDREHGFDEALVIPSTHHDIDELDARLRQIYSEEIERPLLRRLALETLDEYGGRLREHPAAKTIHHAYRGGLLEHVVSMADLAIRICDHYPELDRDLVLIGVLFHDLGKLVEIGAMPVNDYTTVGRLVGHVVIGRDLLRQQCEAIEEIPAELRLHLEHLILSHQGRLEFGSPIPPMTSEALALHFIDDLDSKLAQLRQGRETGEPLQYFRGFGRYLYADLQAESSDSASKPADSAQEENSETEPEEIDQPSLDL